MGCARWLLSADLGACDGNLIVLLWLTTTLQCRVQHPPIGSLPCSYHVARRTLSCAHRLIPHLRLGPSSKTLTYTPVAVCSLSPYPSLIYHRCDTPFQHITQHAPPSSWVYRHSRHDSRSIPHCHYTTPHSCQLLRVAPTGLPARADHTSQTLPKLHT